MPLSQVTQLDQHTPKPDKPSPHTPPHHTTRTHSQVGPRACLNPIKIFGGSFGGPVIYDNPAFVSPNAVRAGAGRRLMGGREAGHSQWHAAGPAPSWNPVECVGFDACTKQVPASPTHSPPSLPQIRAALRRQKSGKYSAKVQARQQRKDHVAANPVPKSALADVFA